MDNDNNEKLTLRDQIALQVLPSVLKHLEKYDETIWVSEDDTLLPQFYADAKNIAIMVYALADEMRKVRLQPLT